ncbi:MAG: DUF1800 family protein [Planctomycetota bacterium]
MSIRTIVARILLGLAVLLHAPSAVGQDATDGQTETTSVQLVTAETVVDQYDTRALAFSTKGLEPGTELAVTMVPPDAVTILAPPIVPDGHEYGFMRIRANEPGYVRIDIGDARMHIDVLPRELEDVLQRASNVRIVTPVQSSVIWGRTSIAIEFDDWDRRPVDRVVVQSNAVKDIALTEVPLKHEWPIRLFVGEIGPAQLSFDVHMLTPAVHFSDGNTVTGRPMLIEIINRPAELLSCEAENPPALEERPRRFAGGMPQAVDDPLASGRKFVANNGAYPPVCVPIDVDREGWYQVIARARGSRAGGAFPTVGITLDEEFQSRTTGRVIAENWHRIAVGRPIRLDAGSHVITPFFENDFFVPRRADRNLHLDRIEIARVGESFREMLAFDHDARLRQFDDGMGTEPYFMRTGLFSPRDGSVVSGHLTVRGFVGTLDPERETPEVECRVNGQRIASQTTFRPEFTVDAGMLQDGVNRVQLIARNPRYGMAPSVVNEVLLDRDLLPVTTSPRPRQRFTMLSGAWDEAIARRRVNNVPGATEPEVVAFYSNGEVALNVPADFAGPCRIVVNAAGQHFGGAPNLRVVLRHDGDEHTLADLDVPTNWTDLDPLDVDLPDGVKSIAFQFTNDRYIKDKGDRNLYLQAVTLTARNGSDDAGPPNLDVLWPKPDAQCGVYDTLIVNAADDQSFGLTFQPFTADGMALMSPVRIERSTGPFVLPLILRDLEPGEHQLVVRVTDDAGQWRDSSPVPIEVVAGTSEPSMRCRAFTHDQTEEELDRWPDSALKPTAMIIASRPDDARAPTAFEYAVRLLTRFGDGPDPLSLIALLCGSSPSEWLERDLTGDSRQETREHTFSNAAAVFPANFQSGVTQRALLAGAFDPNPARHRLGRFIDNHFSTWIRKVNAVRVWDDHAMYMANVNTRFPELLRMSSRSPAMLRYLDQDRSFAGQMNENYAREIMELHTLGVDGGYTQSDVTALARLFTGWTMAIEGSGTAGIQIRPAESHRFVASLHDRTPVTFLGRSFPRGTSAERKDAVLFAIDMLAAHPSTAQFIADKMCAHYVGDHYPEILQHMIAPIYLETHGDLAAMVQRIEGESHFERFMTTARSVSPVDYAIRHMRREYRRNPWAAGQFVGASGMTMFDRASPDGYPDHDTSWTDSNALLQRWTYAETAAAGVLQPMPVQYRDATFLESASNRQQVIDWLAIRICGAELSPTTTAAADTVLQSTDLDAPARIRTVAAFILASPEAGMR